MATSRAYKKVTEIHFWQQRHQHHSHRLIEIYACHSLVKNRDPRKWTGRRKFDHGGQKLPVITTPTGGAKSYDICSYKTVFFISDNYLCDNGVNYGVAYGVIYGVNNSLP